MIASPFVARPAGRPAWTLGALAIALVAGLLLVFVRVLHAGVAEGAQRRQTVLEHQDAQWQCSRLPQRQARAECRARLPDPAPAPANF